MRPTTSVKVTDTEMLLLVSVDRPEIAEAVAAARGRLTSIERYPDLTPEHAGFIADVILEARTNGRLTRLWRRIRYCSLCGASGEYRLPSKRHKNERYYPIHGVELAYRVVTMREHVALGCCDTCWHAVESTLLAALQDVPAEYPTHWEGAPQRWKRHDNKKCTACDWTGHEGEMARLPTVMGGGTYPGQCPECGAKNEWLGPQNIETVDGFTVVEVSP